MTASKRLFDIVLALVLCLPLLPIIAVLGLVILLTDGRPIFYVSERMRTPSQGFKLLKFRTMKTTHSDSGVSGGDKQDRVTKVGRVLRRTRLDELPQLWNVLRGDISFVGPRPPLRQYVERFPEIYGRVLLSRPGITGLASLHLHNFEERVLARARTLQETDAAYTEICIPRKARLDNIYSIHSNICLDIKILFQTALKVFALSGKK